MIICYMIPYCIILKAVGRVGSVANKHNPSKKSM